MMTTCLRRIQFCAGHRVMGHEGKCANVHGHNYVAWIHAHADKLDAIGRIIDFSVLKEKVGGWIELFWDHTFIAYEKDVELIKCVRACQHHKPVFVAPFNPTAEEMARHLLLEVCPWVLHGTGVKVTRVELYETENCKADVCL